MHVFTLLGEPVRLRIVELLAKREHSVWQLARDLGPEFSIGRTAISNHLRVLRLEEFVVVREIGLQRWYRLAWNAMDRLDGEVERLFTIWEDRAGWPYDPFAPPPPEQLHRAGRKGLRGRTRHEIEPDADDPWERARQH